MKVIWRFQIVHQKPQVERKIIIQWPTELLLHCQLTWFRAWPNIFMIQSGYIYTVYIIKPFDLYLLDTDLLTQILVSCPLMSFIYKRIEMHLSLGIDKIFDLCKKSFPFNYSRQHDFLDRYGISVSQMTTDMFHVS
jgi:hypothetical protein